MGCCPIWKKHQDPLAGPPLPRGPAGRVLPPQVPSAGGALALPASAAAPRLVLPLLIPRSLSTDMPPGCSFSQCERMSREKRMKTSRMQKVLGPPTLSTTRPPLPLCPWTNFLKQLFLSELFLKTFKSPKMLTFGDPTSASRRKRAHFLCKMHFKKFSEMT